MDRAAFLRLAASTAAVLALCAAPGAWAQQKQKVSYKVDAENTRGFSDYINSNGLSVNYGVFTAENGDRFYATSRTMGHADDEGKRSTLSVGQITGGTGKFSGMRGLVRARGASDGKRGFNETQAEIEYWFVDR